MKQCLNCARKHIGKAHAYMAEWLHGYEHHKWYCIAELCMAEEHTSLEWPSLAQSIWEARKKIEDDETLDLDDLMIQACESDVSFTGNVTIGGVDIGEMTMTMQVKPEDCSEEWAWPNPPKPTEPSVFMEALESDDNGEVVRIRKNPNGAKEVVNFLNWLVRTYDRVVEWGEKEVRVSTSDGVEQYFGSLDLDSLKYFYSEEYDEFCNI